MAGVRVHVKRRKFLVVLRQALSSISEPRLFRSERGYQGALLSELQARLTKRSLWPGNPIVEQEYQKRAREHGITVRPDLIMHIPYERGQVRSRTHGNYAVVELKRRASREEALEDFRKLSQTCIVLDYPIGVFINIDSDKTYFSEYEGAARERLCAIAVELKDGVVVLHGT